MKILLGVVTCHRYDYLMKFMTPRQTLPSGEIQPETAGYCVTVPTKHHRDSELPFPVVVRQTWGRWVKGVAKDTSLELTLRFIYGTGGIRKPKSDEIFLDCPDGYHRLVEKTRALIKYALDNDYDFLLKCDDDTFLSREVIKSLSSDPDVDFMGHEAAIHGHYYGGAYRLSKRAMKILNAQTTIPLKSYQVPLDGKSVTAYCPPPEDTWVSAVIFHHPELTRRGNDRYSGWSGGDRGIDSCTHFNVSIKEMRRMYKQDGGL